MLLKSAVGAGVGPTESHVAEDARTAIEQRFGAGVERGSGGEDIIDEHYVLTMQSCTITHAKRPVNVRGTLCGSQPRLRFRRSMAREDIGPRRNTPVFTQSLRECGGLIESSFTLAGGVERHWHQRRSFAHHIGRPV